jgi:ABC-2 type transport system permease protein
VVQLPTENFDPAGFRLMLDAGLKRFASGFTKIVALAAPQVDPQMAQYKMGGPTFTNLEKAIGRDYSIRPEDLSDGSVAPEADILAVVAPQALDEKSIFAIDQFLMRGGTVVLATSPFTTELGGGELRLQKRNSGLQQWLAHNGLRIENTLVLDKQNASFPAPINRKSGSYEFRDVQLIDYPYFIDLRPPGLTPDHAVTSNLPQVTMAWASPITVQTGNGRRTSVLLKSSANSWLSNSPDIMPSVDANGLSNFRPPDDAQDDKTGASPALATRTLGVAVQGRFESFFKGKDNPLATVPAGANAAPYSAPTAGGQLQRSPESARIVLFASNDFMDDQILNSIVMASGTQYLGPLELFMNSLDWALLDEELLGIRSRAHFNRTLPPMERKAQLLLEYLNYGVALLWLLALALTSWLLVLLRRRHYAKGLSL